jgi:hypothetical protein
MLFRARPSVIQAMADVRRRPEISRPSLSGTPMAELLRNPAARPWIFSISQAAVMLVLNLLLRVGVA